MNPWQTKKAQCTLYSNGLNDDMQISCTHGILFYIVSSISWCVSWNIPLTVSGRKKYMSFCSFAEYFHLLF